jgi:hypothetical protein
MSKLAGRLLFYFVSVEHFLSFHFTPLQFQKDLQDHIGLSQDGENCRTVKF